MIVILLGYMASGKSTIGKILAKKLNYEFLDLDDFIEASEKRSIKDIFETLGEIYFRKKESYYLSKILSKSNNIVLALGGGTPCYGNNMEMLLQHRNVTSVYLNATIKSLVNRLENEKEKRPLISHLKTKHQLNEFVGKHLFERFQFYNKANYTINTDDKNENEIVEAIILRLF